MRLLATGGDARECDDRAAKRPLIGAIDPELPLQSPPQKRTLLIRREADVRGNFVFISLSTDLLGCISRERWWSRQAPLFEFLVQDSCTYR